MLLVAFLFFINRQGYDKPSSQIDAPAGFTLTMQSVKEMEAKFLYPQFTSARYRKRRLEQAANERLAYKYLPSNTSIGQAL